MSVIWNEKLFWICMASYIGGIILSCIIIYIMNIIAYKQQIKDYYERGGDREIISFDEFNSKRWDNGEYLAGAVLWPFTFIAIIMEGICVVIKIGLKKLFKV